MKSSDEINSTEPTPEQLLNLLDAQMRASRQKRATQESGRRRMQVTIILLIVVGAGFALWILTFLLNDMKHARQHEENESIEQGSPMELR